jgi:hypothetical protein
MRKSNFALRLQPSLREEARKLAEAEGVALNQLINVSVAEKLSALRTESYITENCPAPRLTFAVEFARRAITEKSVARCPERGHERTKSDVLRCPGHVRLAPDSGPMTDIGRGQFRANKRPSAWQQGLSITSSEKKKRSRQAPPLLGPPLPD